MSGGNGSNGGNGGEPEVLTNAETTMALSHAERAEIDMQVATAKKFPRDLARFRSDAETMATLDEETAQECFYVIPRGGKNIEGPGVRLAEIMVSCWGNMRCEAEVVEEGDEFLTAAGTAWDLEKNVAIRMKVRRRITDRNGRKFSEDMRVVTGNAAAAIAFRNAAFKVIPNAFTRAIYRKARAVAVGDDRTLSDRRTSAVGWFNKSGVSTERLLAFINREGIEAIDLKNLETLQGVRTAIREGSSSIDEIFAQVAPPTAPDEPQAGKHKVGGNGGNGKSKQESQTAEGASPTNGKENPSQKTNAPSAKPPADEPPKKDWSEVGPPPMESQPDDVEW